MSLVKQSLQISSVGVEDGGDYICNVETVGRPLDQVHTLDVLGKYNYRESYTINPLPDLSKCLLLSAAPDTARPRP